MFCTKCGTNVSEGIFCPKCGNKIITAAPEVTIGTPTEMPATPEATVGTPQMPMTQEAPIGTPVENAFSFGIEKPIKKKKKWPKVAGILAAVLIVLGVAGYFIYPMILPIISPKAYAVSALKNTTSKLANNVDTVITNADFSAATTPQEVSMTLQLDKLDIQSGTVLSDFSGKNVTMTIQVSPSDQVETGTITLGTSGVSALSVQFYIDASTITFKIPELSSQTFSMDISSFSDNSDYSYNEISGMLGSLTASDIQEYMDQYSPLIKAVVQDTIKGLDTIIDNADYKRTDSKTYESENGNMKVSVYDIVISEATIKKGVLAIINNIFNDKELSSYVSLLTLGTGQTKQSLITEVANAELGIDKIQFTVYINNKKEIVKTIFDLNKITGDDAAFSVEFIGKDSIYDYVVTNMSIEGTTAKLIAKNEANEFYYGADVRPDQTTYKDQFLTFGIQGKTQKSGSDVNITIDKMFATGSIEGEDFDIALSGNTSSKAISSVPSKSSSFSKAIDVEYITTTQEKAILTEMATNIPKLKGKLPDSLVSQMTTYVNSELATLK